MNLLYQLIGRSEGVSKLLHHFYADVRQDPLIGPIFNVKIKDWKHHLEIITTGEGEGGKNEDTSILTFCQIFSSLDDWAVASRLRLKDGVVLATHTTIRRNKR